MTKSSRNVKKHQDRISKLPNEVLVSIISRLTLREATTTSILSTSWRYLHMYLTHLDFPSFSYSRDPRGRDIVKERLSNYENMVNHILDSHRGGEIKEFKVDISDLKGAHFKKWFEFALTNGAEIIHIKMLHKGHFLRLSNSILLHGLKCLKELSLSMIDVANQDFELLVSNCLALESLSIMSPNKLKKVSIVGHSNLKHLDLCSVWALESIEIRDVINLVSFKCYEVSHRCVVQLRNIPKLIELSFGEDYDGLPHGELLAKIPSAIRDQLQLLHLSFSLMYPTHRRQKLPFEFVNIKHLEAVFDMSMSPTSFLLYHLIQACPSLEKLTIKFLWELSRKAKLMRVEAAKYSPYANELPLKCLKELVITGYLGAPPELRLALDVVNNAGALKTFVVVPYNLISTVRQKAIARARRDFRQIKSSSVKLSII